MQTHDGMQSSRAATACLSDEPQQSILAASQLPLQEGQDQGQDQMQGQGQTQGHSQGQRQGQEQQQGQSSGGGSEEELAVVEQGLSVLEQQITAAALRYASHTRHCYAMCMCATRTTLTCACASPRSHAEISALLQWCQIPGMAL